MLGVVVIGVNGVKITWTGGQTFEGVKCNQARTNVASPRHLRPFPSTLRLSPIP